MRDKNNKINTNPSSSTCAKKYLGVIFLYNPHTGGGLGQWLWCGLFVVYVF